MLNEHELASMTDEEKEMYRKKLFNEFFKNLFLQSAFKWGIIFGVTWALRKALKAKEEQNQK